MATATLERKIAAAPKPVAPKTPRPSPVKASATDAYFIRHAIPQWEY